MIFQDQVYMFMMRFLHKYPDSWVEWACEKASFCWLQCHEGKIVSNVKWWCNEWCMVVINLISSKCYLLFNLLKVSAFLISKEKVD
jgi:hypothetical protein